MAEGEGFEPPEPCGSVVFKTTAIVHSAIPPARDEGADAWSCGGDVKRGGFAPRRVQTIGGGALPFAGEPT